MVVLRNHPAKGASELVAPYQTNARAHEELALFFGVSDPGALSCSSRERRGSGRRASGAGRQCRNARHHPARFWAGNPAPVCADSGGPPLSGRRGLQGGNCPLGPRRPRTGRAPVRSGTFLPRGEFKASHPPPRFPILNYGPGRIPSELERDYPDRRNMAKWKWEKVDKLTGTERFLKPKFPDFTGNGPGDVDTRSAVGAGETGSHRVV